MIFKKASSSFSLLFSCFILDFFFAPRGDEHEVKIGDEEWRWLGWRPQTATHDWRWLIDMESVVVFGTVTDDKEERLRWVPQFECFVSGWSEGMTDEWMNEWQLNYINKPITIWRKHSTIASFFEIYKKRVTKTWKKVKPKTRRGQPGLPGPQLPLRRSKVTRHGTSGGLRLRASARLASREKRPSHGGSSRLPPSS